LRHARPQRSGWLADRGFDRDQGNGFYPVLGWTIAVVQRVGYMSKIIKRFFADNSTATSIEIGLVAALLGAVVLTTAIVLHH
jgi:hypothetical protein